MFVFFKKSSPVEKLRPFIPHVCGGVKRNFERYAIILAYHVNILFRGIAHVANDKLREAVSSHLARLLKEERESQKVSLQALARKAGLARQTITFIETETQSPTFDTMFRITSALNVDLAKLIARAQKRASKKP